LLVIAVIMPDMAFVETLKIERAHLIYQQGYREVVNGGILARRNGLSIQDTQGLDFRDVSIVTSPKPVPANPETTLEKPSGHS
jgi:hypothetical protein